MEQSDVKNQHDRPTCVAFAVTALHEHAYDVLNGVKVRAEIDLSEEYLHYHSKKRDGLKQHSSGTTIVAACESLTMEGQALEPLCPYQPFLPKGEIVSPTQVALVDGKTRLLLGLRRLNPSLASIRDSLRLSRPVIAVLDWYSNAYRAPQGLIELPGAADRLLGQHAVLVIEYMEETQSGACTITFKNSWGPKWGDKGFGCFGPEYYRRYGREIWGLAS